MSEVHKHQCVSLAVSEDGRYLLTAGQNSLKVWDYDMHLDVNSQVCLFEHWIWWCAEYIMKSRMCLFLLQVFIGHSEPIRQVRFTPDQMGVVTVGDALFFWDFLAPPQQISRCRSELRFHNTVHGFNLLFSYLIVTRIFFKLLKSFSLPTRSRALEVSPHKSGTIR